MLLLLPSFCLHKHSFTPTAKFCFFSSVFLHDQFSWINNLLLLSGGLQICFHQTDSLNLEKKNTSKTLCG